MKKYLLFIAFVLPYLNVLAASGGGGTGGGNTPPTPRGAAPPPGLPVDQYLIPLFLAGIIIFIIVKKRKIIA